MKKPLCPDRAEYSVDIRNRVIIRTMLMVTVAAMILSLASLTRLEEDALAYSNPPKEEIRGKLYAAAVARNIPPEILYGIAYQESGWRQFDSNGDPLISPDFGYGIMQVTSVGSYDIEKLKYDIDYNINAGANILMEKWQWVPSIGDDAMNCYEHWFYAVWAYNGWVPNNVYPYAVFAHVANGPMGWWEGVPVTPVPQEWLVNGYGVQVPTPQPAHYWEPPLNSYFAWYDSVNSRNWVLVANPGDAGVNVASSISIAGVSQAMGAVPGQYPGVIPPGESLASSFPGQMGGPVLVSTSSEAIISQRILFGDSIEEVPAIPPEDLSNHYYWTWYDMVTEGFKNWVLVSNPGSSDIYFQIRLDGVLLQEDFLIPGETKTPIFPDFIGGPLEVEAWTDASMSAPADVIASQRVTTGFDQAFNEAQGIPAETLSNDYYWTWYDNYFGSNWILLANPNDIPVTYQIEIGNGGCSEPAPEGTACQAGALAAAGDLEDGDIVTPQFPGVMNGPVRVTSEGGSIIASQRVVVGASFGETPGTRADSLAQEYFWTWYDGIYGFDWVLVANPGVEAITYTLKINGAIPAGYLDRPLAAGGIDKPKFPGMMGGPVEVTATGPVIASQRVLFNGYFNEVIGTAPAAE